VDGYIWSDNTSDYFTFVLETMNKVVRIHVYNQHVWDAYEDLRLHIYDAAENEIELSDNDRLEDEYIDRVSLYVKRCYCAVGRWDGDRCRLLNL
jgi:hypothetical protein